jgi:hypothetical protein
MSVIAVTSNCTPPVSLGPVPPGPPTPHEHGGLSPTARIDTRIVVARREATLRAAADAGTLLGTGSFPSSTAAHSCRESYPAGRAAWPRRAR